MAVVHTGGALFAWFLLGIILFVIAAWDHERIRRRRLQEAALTLGVSLSSLESDESLGPQLLDYSSRRFSNELLRNRLSDFCGILRTCWNWLGALVQIGLIGGITWAMYTSGREQAVYMWSVLPVTIFFWLAAVVFALACLLLTGRYPGEAKSAREALLAFIEQRPPRQDIETRAAALWAVPSGLAALVAFVMVFAAGEKGHGNGVASEPPTQVSAASWNTSVTSPEPRPIVTNTAALADSTRTALSAAEFGTAPPVPQFASTESRLSYLKWLNATSVRLATNVSDKQFRTELLQTVWFESRRAALEPAVVLAIIEVASGFNTFYTSQTGERGLMAVAPKWSNLIGDGNTEKLFNRQVGLRFGCVLLRHFLDQRKGDVVAALSDYWLANLPDGTASAVGDQFSAMVMERAQHWLNTSQSRS